MLSERGRSGTGHRGAGRLAGAIVGLVILVPGAAQLAGAQSGASTRAEIVDFDYQPGDLSIAVGTTVTWRNTGARPHTVTDRGGTFDTNPILPGTDGSVTFTVPGTYHFFCRINPQKMNGVITVGPGPEPSRVNRIEAIDPALAGESLRYSGTNLEVPTGSTIVFANVGGKPHTLTADDGTFDTGVVPPGPEGGRFAGTNATVTLSRPGTFAFHCEIHPAAMKGVLVVTGEARAGPAPGPASSAATEARVDVADFAFKPAQVSVAPGGQVTWHNGGQAPHTATFDDVQLDTGTMKPGTEGRLTAPDKPGSYSYRCAIHPAKMRGVLVVVGQNAADPTKAPLGRPAAAVPYGGPGGGLSALVLVTAVVAAFCGGVGIAAFTLNRRVGTLNRRVGTLNRRVGTLNRRVGPLNQRSGTLNRRRPAAEPPPPPPPP